MKNPFGWKKTVEEKEQKTSRGRFADAIGKVGHFFSPIPQKEKVLRHEDFNAAGDVYYANVSAGYKVAQRFLWVIFVFFMAFSIMFHYKEITYDNFFYLIRDFSSAVDSDSTNYETISYESAPGQHFSLYRGGVAVVSPSGVSAFTATGRRTLQETSSFSSPVVVASDKYMLVYDTAGTTFSVYNSFARIYTENLDYPIIGACFGKDGSFAVVTREADRHAVVHVYDDQFRLRKTFKGNSYIFDIAMDSDRDRMVFVSYGAGDGTGETLLSVRQISTMEEITQLSFSGEFPLDCGFMENHRFALITNGSVRIISDTFEEESVQEEAYYNGNVTGFLVSDQGVAVSLVHASRNEVLAFDKNGDVLYHDVVSESVTNIGVYSHYVFLQTERGVLRLNTQTEEEEMLLSGNGKMLLYNEHTAVVCGESKAEYLIYSN